MGEKYGRCALLLIDVQKGFKDPFWGERNNPFFELNVEALLRHWREKSRKIYHVRHLSRDECSPLHPQTQGVEFMDFAFPIEHETVFEKSVNSAFIGTNLEKELKKSGIESLVLVGLTSDHCVSTSARMAANLGFQVTIVSDATATFTRSGLNGEEGDYPAKLVHAVSLASLNGEFAEIISTEKLLSDSSRGTS